MEKGIPSRELSACEELIMKIVWDRGDNYLSTSQLTKELLMRYGKNYARTTTITMLQRLVEKGFVSTFRKGRVSYVAPQKDCDEYLKKYFKDAIVLWFDGDKKKLDELLKLRDEIKIEP